MKSDMPSGVRHVLQALAESGFEAYLVGGCVRDLLRDVPPHDWDVCTSARPEETKACFAGCRMVETGLKHGTITVIEDGTPCEITTYRTEGPYSDSRRPDFVRFVRGLEEDLARRDFTMNAIAMDLDGNLRDPFGGADDISAGLIRCVGEPARRFQEDGLRVMRALRFAAAFGCEIEEAAAQAIHENRAVLGRVAAERINTELCRLLAGQSAGSILRQYPDVLYEFWPELGPPAALEQNSPPNCQGGWAHTVHAVEKAPADVTLRLAVLLHGAGTQLAERMLKALKFDKKTCGRVVLLVEHCDAALQAESPVIRQWLSRLGAEAFFQLLEVKRADAAGQGPEAGRSRLDQLDEIKARAEQILAERQCLTRKDLAVSGRDVIAAGAAPGPEVGRVLEWLLERVLSGEVPNDREALCRLTAVQCAAGSKGIRS